MGAQNALYLLTSLLVDENTRVAMEEPGYPDVRNIFQLKTKHVALVPVDDHGLTLNADLNNAQVVFTTPSHQFPTTATMPHRTAHGAFETRGGARLHHHRGRL